MERQAQLFCHSYEFPPAEASNKFPRRNPQSSDEDFFSRTTLNLDRRHGLGARQLRLRGFSALRKRSPYRAGQLLNS